MPMDLFTEAARCNSEVVYDVAETLLDLWNHSWLRAWPTTKIQAIACDINS